MIVLYTWRRHEMVTIEPKGKFKKENTARIGKWKKILKLFSNVCLKGIHALDFWHVCKKAGTNKLGQFLNQDI